MTITEHCFILLVSVVKEFVVVVPMDSPSHGGDVAVCVFYINQLSLPTPFYSTLVSLLPFQLYFVL